MALPRGDPAKARPSGAALSRQAPASLMIVPAVPNSHSGTRATALTPRATALTPGVRPGVFPGFGRTVTNDPVQHNKRAVGTG